MLKTIKNKLVLKKGNKKGVLNGYKDELHEFVGIITVIAVAVAVFLIFRPQIEALATTVVEWVVTFFSQVTDQV